MGVGKERTEESETARELLEYLAENPDAADTLEGIVEWWLLDRSIDRGIAKVKEVLEQMAARGLIVERKGSDARTRYQLNDERRREIAALLGRELKPPE